MAVILGSQGQIIAEVRNYGAGTSGSQRVEGVDADNDPATARPVGIGGAYRATQPTYGDNDRAEIQHDLRGNLRATLNAGNSTTNVIGANGVLAQGAAAIDAPFVGQPLPSGGRASGVTPTPVTDGDAQALWLSPSGAVVIAGQRTVASGVLVPAVETLQNHATGSAVAAGNPALAVAAYLSAYTSPTTNIGLRTPNVFKAHDALAIATETTIWTPAAGKKFRLMRYHLISSVAGNIVLRDNTAGTIIAVIPSGAGGSGVFVDLGNGILSAAANNVLTATGPATATLSGVVMGTEE